MTDLRQALRLLAISLPAGSAVPVPRETLLELLDGSGATGELAADLTVPQAAKILGRSASTVRQWCHVEQILGAYLFRGKEYRIPRKALEAFQKAERTRKRGEPATPTNSKPGDLGGWRNHIKRAS